jgi:hypothetical protein
MEEARIDVELQNENINNLSRAQEATLAERPVNPSKTLTAAGTICLAIGGVFGLVLLGEFRHPAPTTGVGNISATSSLPIRRRKRRPLTAKSNGHTAGGDIPSLPK